MPVALLNHPTVAPQAGLPAHPDDSASMGQGDIPSVPLAFAPNYGQVDPVVEYTARGNTMHAFFTKEAMVFRLFDEWEDTDGGRYSRGSNLFMNFEGSSTASVTATEPLGSTSNYLFGNVPDAWVTNVPMYGAIQYQELYAGIDLAVHNDNGGFEYDFELAPGVTSEAITLSFDGADSARVDEAGTLVVETAAGTFAQKAPTTWQVLPSGEKIEVTSRFSDLGEGRFGFELGSLDDSLATVIDPLLIWATYLGGAACERVTGVAMDGELNVYATGMTMGSDFPTTAGAFDTIADTRHEGIAFKLSPDGSTLLWSTYFGGEWNDHPNGLALVGGHPGGQTGEIIDRSPVIVGETHSWNFPTTPGSFQPFKGAGSDAFVMRLSPNGDSLDWSSFLGDRDIDLAWGVDTNQADEVVVVGETQSVGFGTPGAFQTVKGSHKDAFVAKITADGTAVMWSSFIGGNDDDWALAVSIDRFTDEVAVGGVTNSTDFPTTAGAIGSTFLGGAFITGMTESIDFPETGIPVASGLTGFRDIFVAQVEKDGINLEFSTYLGAGTMAEAEAIAQDFATGAITAAGRTRVNFPVTGGAYDTSYNGGSGDHVVVRLDPKPCPSSATVQTLGTPCGAVLSSTLPIMGKPITVTLTGGTPNTLAFLFRSSAGAAPIQIEGCDLWLDFADYAQYPFITDSAGSVSVSVIIPNDSARCGLQFVLQGLVLDATSGPLSFGQVTNGLLETMGS
ncbi:MAG: hypothetical protein H8D72_00820 [Planctomycetes bacterium]|nr:hypothetical protein [Planctomycetota bacterium]